MVALCLFEFVLYRHWDGFQAFESAILQTGWMLLVCLTVWGSAFFFLTFQLKDLCLIGLLAIAILTYAIDYARYSAVDVLVLLFGATLGRAMRLALKNRKWNSAGGIRNFLIGLVLLLAFSSWWHLDMANNVYHGPRWMGLWNNPNDYGILMSAGTLLAIGLLAASPMSIRLHPIPSQQEVQNQKPHRFLQIILFIAAGMMAVGLFFSYSRGAWLGTTVGLLYLAKAYGKLKWRYVLPGIIVVATIILFFWHSTPDTAPWYLKRMDFGRASAQHRVAAWKAGIEIMRDHPFGVGWNKTVETYEKNYSPPEGGASAITTNDYLMLGTQLGWLGLLCFLAYIALCFKNNPQTHETLVCRAGALIMLVAFWFDGGLFTLATASVFWILLELGTSDLTATPHCSGFGGSAKRQFPFPRPHSPFR